MSDIRDFRNHEIVEYTGPDIEIKDQGIDEKITAGMRGTVVNIAHQKFNDIVSVDFNYSGDVKRDTYDIRFMRIVNIANLKRVEAAGDDRP